MVTDPETVVNQYPPKLRRNLTEAILDFWFPRSVDDDHIDARYNNGVLEITLPVHEGVTTCGKTIEVEG